MNFFYLIIKIMTNNKIIDYNNLFLKLLKY